MKAPPIALLPLLFPLLAVAADPPEPRFQAVTIDAQVQIGYGVAVADVDGDGKPDIILVDKKQIVWFKNPGGDLASAPPWKKYVIAENLTPRDNVCLAVRDIDDDGKILLAVGADWDPADTEHSGAVFDLVPPADRTQRWEAIKLPNEPVTHRMRWVQLADGKWGLVVLPLHGRGNKNGEGAPVKMLLYHPPAGDPHGEWTTEVLDESMHMTHNFTLADDGSLVEAGKEGAVSLREGSEGWTRTPLITPEIAEAANRADEANRAPVIPGVEGPAAIGPIFKGIGEVRFGRKPQAFIATVEPMHGNSLVCYLPPEPGVAGSSWRRHVLTHALNEGHALACGDLLGTGGSQIVAGWRGNPQHPKPVGIHLWTPLDLQKDQWRESVVDDDGMACEDLQLADLDGDGRLDIIASGRSTHNLKIYLNKTPVP